MENGYKQMDEEQKYINNGLKDDVQWYKDCYPSEGKKLMENLGRRVELDPKDDEGDLNETQESTKPELELSPDEWF